MIQGALWDVVVVGVEVVGQRELQLLGRREPGLFDELTDAPIKALDHAIGLRMSWRDKAVLYPLRDALLIEQMLASRLLGFTGETVGELAAVIRQYLGDIEGCRLAQAAQEICAAGLGLVAVDTQIDPARGSVYRHEQIAAAVLVGHLRQVLDVNVNEARYVVFERLFWRVFAVLFGLQVLQLGHPLTAQQPADARAGGVGMDEAAGDADQVVQWHKTQSTNLYHHGLLGQAQRSAQVVGPVGAIQYVITAFPLARGGYADVVPLS